MSSTANHIEVIVRKRKRTLLLYREARLMRTYPVALDRNWAADKAMEGDEATPIGEFYICAKNPRSRYLLSLCISYPNAEVARGSSGNYS
jgi:murein L,D-transpeptidase YafK